MKREEFEKLNGKLSDNVTYIDLDEQQVPPEPTTCGWTDTQIRNKSLEEFDAMISSGEMGIASLQQTLDNEVKRIEDLRRVRNRKTDL
jgi:hypothetical protein